MDGSPMLPALRVVSPGVSDYPWVATRMRADEKAQVAALTGRPFDADAFARLLLSLRGEAYAVIGRDEFPVLLGGFTVERPGVLRAWLAGTEAGWQAHAIGFTRICRRAMRGALAAGYHRIEVVSLASRTGAHDWYEHALGMRDEGEQAMWFADGQNARFHALTQRKEA